MDSQERKIIVDTKIVDNFIESSKNVAYWREELKNAQKQGEEYRGDVNKVVRELAKANNEFRASKKALDASTQAEALLSKTTEDTIQTLDQMQRELSALRRLPHLCSTDRRACPVPRQRRRSSTESNYSH